MQAVTAFESRRWIGVFADRCQAIAGSVAATPWADVAVALRELTANVPPLPARERVVLHALVTNLLGNVARITGIGRAPELAAAFVAFAAVGPASEKLPGAIERIAARCASALETCDEPTIDTGVNGRVGRALVMIHQRFDDPHLTMKDVAQELRTSVWHAARLLKKVTGSGFSGHVHRLRIAAGCRLLHDTTLSVKEIADTVGYGSSSQFGRHFRRLTATTPYVRPNVAAEDGHKDARRRQGRRRYEYGERA